MGGLRLGWRNDLGYIMTKIGYQVDGGVDVQAGGIGSWVVEHQKLVRCDP